MLTPAHDMPASASSRKSFAPVSSLSNKSSPPIWTIFKGELHSPKSAWARIWEADKSARRSARQARQHCKKQSIDKDALRRSQIKTTRLVSRSLPVVFVNPTCKHYRKRSGNQTCGLNLAKSKGETCSKVCFATLGTSTAEQTGTSAQVKLLQLPKSQVPCHEYRLCTQMQHLI